MDWEKTRAYAVGLGGIYLNLAGRERQGVVPRCDTQKLKKELCSKLKGLRDDQTGELAIREVYDTHKVYSGPYVADGPDLVVGFSTGYRASWLSVTGGVTDQVLENNLKSWSGDHCINPPEVPGILFCNSKIDRTHIEITDIAPTVLDLFGVPIPKWMDGNPFLCNRKKENDEN